MRSILIMLSCAISNVALAQTLVPIPSSFAIRNGMNLNFKASIVGNQCIATYTYKDGMTGNSFATKVTWDAKSEAGATRCTGGAWRASGDNGGGSGAWPDIMIKGGKAYWIR